MSKITKWKFGLTTREIEEISPDEFIIHDYSSGWHQAKVDKETLDKVLSGNVSLLSLEWH